MIFEVGKCYQHTNGEQMKICGTVDTTLYGNTLVAETNSHTNLEAVGRDKSSAMNWKEISHKQWMVNFS